MTRKPGWHIRAGKLDFLNALKSVSVSCGSEDIRDENMDVAYSTYNLKAKVTVGYNEDRRLFYVILFIIDDLGRVNIKPHHFEVLCPN